MTENQPKVVHTYLYMYIFELFQRLIFGPGLVFRGTNCINVTATAPNIDSRENHAGVICVVAADKCSENLRNLSYRTKLWAGDVATIFRTRRTITEFQYSSSLIARHRYSDYVIWRVISRQTDTTSVSNFSRNYRISKNSSGIFNQLVERAKRQKQS